MVAAPVRFGIQARLMVGIGVVASVLTAAIGWYWVAFEAQEQRAALLQRQAQMAGLVARAFSGPVWNLDTAAIDNLLDAVMADPEVQSIEVRSTGCMRSR